MKTDFHSHILPGMDDGARDVETSLEMLNILKNQGIKEVFATSHFYIQRDSLEGYLKRRSRAYSSLISSQPAIKKIRLGAEVYLQKNIHKTRGLERLAIEDSRFILLELPYTAFNEWMLTEIKAISKEYGLIPVVAHLHRYGNWYSASEINKVLNLDCVFQINADTFQTPTEAKLTLKMINEGYPLVFGSDTHNLTTRPPHFNLLNESLSTHLTSTTLNTLLTNTNKIITKGILR